jgi:hypothetical protein
LKSERTEEGDEPPEETTAANAGAQFGSHSNQKKHRS